MARRNEKYTQEMRERTAPYILEPPALREKMKGILKKAVGVYK